MADDLVVSSTTDTAADIKAALDHGTAPPPDDQVLGVVEETTEEKPAAAETPAAGETDEKAEPTEEAEAGKVADKAPDDGKAKKEKPKRESFKDEAEFKSALEKFNVQKRIDKLTWEKGEEKRRADAAEAERDSLKRTQAAAGRRVPEPSEAEKKAVAEAEAVPEPKAEDYETHEEWQKALTGWTVKQEVAKQFAEQREKDAEAAQNAEQESLHRTFVDSKPVARNRYEDFDAVIKSNSDMPVTGTMAYAMIKAGELGHDMSYYLATHRDEADAIASLGDSADAISAMGELKATVRQIVRGLPARAAAAEEDAAAGGEDESRHEGAKPAARKPAAVSKTPDPIAPVSGRASNTKVALDTAPYDEFKAQRERQIADRRKQIRGR